MTEKFDKIDQNLENEINKITETLNLTEELTEQNIDNKEIELLEATKLELAEFKDKYIRSLADIDNLRKRSEKQIEDASKYAISGFTKEITEVLENLYRASENINKDDLASNETLKNIYSGIDLTISQINKVFDKFSVTRIMPSIGDDFDHNLHQVVMQVPTEEFEENKIVNILQAGYMLHDRLIKPAIVGVSKKV